MVSWFREVPVFGWQLISGHRLRHEKYLAQLRHSDLAAHIAWERPQRILDLANGSLQPQTMILSRQGHRVVGIDIVNGQKSGLFSQAYTLARAIYSLQLGQITQSSLSGLVQGNVNQLPFKANTFDVISSIAAFEHFLDVPAVLFELIRVLKPQGYAWVCIHPFSCPSGGHNVSLTQVPLRSIPPGVEAWDHLRERRLPFHVPLNEWRIAQYVDEFSKHFEVVKSYCALREGEHLLKPAIQQELSDYSASELTCLAYIILARNEKP